MRRCAARSLLCLPVPRNEKGGLLAASRVVHRCVLLRLVAATSERPRATLLDTLLEGIDRRLAGHVSGRQGGGEGVDVEPFGHRGTHRSTSVKDGMRFQRIGIRASDLRGRARARVPLAHARAGLRNHSHSSAAIACARGARPPSVSQRENPERRPPSTWPRLARRDAGGAEGLVSSAKRAGSRVSMAPSSRHREARVALWASGAPARIA